MRRSSDCISTLSLRTKTSPPVVSSAEESLARAGSAAAAATAKAIADRRMRASSPALLAIEIGDLVDGTRPLVGGLQHEARRARGAGDLRARVRDQRRLLVVMVDVVAEVDQAVARAPAGEIDPGDRNLMRKPHVGALALGDGGVDLAAAPARIVLQQPGGEIARVLDPRAARGLEAVIGAEEFLVAGVVHVDRIRIGHVDADRAERVPGAGILTEG